MIRLKNIKGLLIGILLTQSIAVTSVHAQESINSMRQESSEQTSHESTSQEEPKDFFDDSRSEYETPISDDNGSELPPPPDPPSNVVTEEDLEETSVQESSEETTEIEESTTAEVTTVVEVTTVGQDNRPRVTTRRPRQNYTVVSQSDNQDLYDEQVASRPLSGGKVFYHIIKSLRFVTQKLPLPTQVIFPAISLVYYYYRKNL